MKKWLFAGMALLLVSFYFPAQAQDTKTQLLTRSELEEGWNQLSPGGDTICSRGTPYSFFVRPANSERVLIHFQGGGACWNENNCSVEEATFQAEARPLPDNAYSNGIFDASNPENPLQNYNAVIVSYCTGDVHTGNQTVDYADELTIEHKGAVNSEAVLDWVYENFPEPEDVVITGCSAGAYGSIYFADSIMSQYSDIQVRQLGDAGVGVIPEEWEGLDLWATNDSLSEEYRSATADVGDDRFLEAIYIETASRFPNNRFGEVTTNFDGVQTGFYFMMGQIGWSGLMRDTIERRNQAVDNYYSYISAGESHCILQRPEYYRERVEDIPFNGWFTNFLNGEDLRSVACRGEDCEAE